MSRRRARTPAWFKPLAATVAVSVALLLAEGVSRMVEPLLPDWQGMDPGGVIMVGHPTRLWGMGPGVRSNAGTEAKISALGIREPVPEVPRPKGRQRVMIVGDSTFFGHGVPDDATMAAQLVGRLAERGIEADTINGGIPGYSSEQTRMLLEEVGWKLEPTLLVIGNLWSDNNFDHFRDADLLRTRQVYLENPLSKSSLFRLLAGQLDRLRGGEEGRIVTWTRKSRLPKNGVRRVPLQRYAENLDAMVREASRRGIGVALLAPCNIHMATGQPADEEVWQPYFDAQLAVAKHHGLPRIESKVLMAGAAAAQGGAALYVDEMHPSPAGNAVFAEAIAQGLTAAGWPTKPLLGKQEPFAQQLEDVVPGGVWTSTNPLSPQVNLFPTTVPDWTAVKDAADQKRAADEAKSAAKSTTDAGAGGVAGGSPPPAPGQGSSR
jgi:lysophospholipase L1-like esterase